MLTCRRSFHRLRDVLDGLKDVLDGRRDALGV
jgi:hypothetical protein